MNRNHVFLEAMGLGPQWRLRNAPAVTDAEFAAEVMAAVAGDFAGAEAAAYPDHTMAQGADSTPAGVQAAPPAAPNTVGPAAAAPVAQVSATAAHALAPMAANPAAAGGGAAAGAAHAAGLPQAASAGAPAAMPSAARATESSGEDTSWFDDAPAAPSTRPALKSAPPAKAAPPARPAAPAPARPGAGNHDNPGATTGAESGDESYAWFDDVPATPIAKPERKPAPEPEPEDEAPWRGAAAGRPAAGQGPQGRPARPASPAAQAMPDDGIPWFDDAPLPSFDAGFDELYGDAASDANTDANSGTRSGAGVSDAAIARMDLAALQAAVQACTRCTLCRERSAAVPGRGAPSAPWLLLATAPNGDDEAQARPLAGAPGQLLDNMLKAIGVAPETQAYVTTLVKCRPQGDRAPTFDELAACRPYLERELALAGSRAVITLGHTAAKGLLGAAARGKVLRLEQLPVVATYHPADLLRKPEDKARAWADLCLARSAFDGRA